MSAAVQDNLYICNLELNFFKSKIHGLVDLFKILLTVPFTSQNELQLAARPVYVH